MNYKSNLVPHQNRSKYLGNFYKYQIGDDTTVYNQSGVSGTIAYRENDDKTYVQEFIEDVKYQEDGICFPTTTVRFWMEDGIYLRCYIPDEWKDNITIELSDDDSNGNNLKITTNFE